ncbi:MAG: hypothetical protein HEP71_21475 [Roseivirga sp.]|nr:hypothetical protein [Roseivirga sp.]
MDNQDQSSSTNSLPYWTNIPLGANGSYGSATCYAGDATAPIVPNLNPTLGPFHYSPMLMLYKGNGDVFDNWYLNITMFTPSETTLDNNIALGSEPYRYGVSMTYMGDQAWVFINLIDSQLEIIPPEPGVSEFRHFFVNCKFESSFVNKIKNKDIYVIVIHGDPEEGEIGKTKIEPEEEID